MAADSSSASLATQGARSRLSQARQQDPISLPRSSANDASNPLKTPIPSLKSPNGSYSGKTILGSPERQRNMSLSSTDIDPAVDGGPINDKADDTKPKKRPSTEVLGYPRRRATIAVRLQLGVICRVNLAFSIVPDMPVKKVALRWCETQVPPVHESESKLHISRAWHQVRCW